MFDELRIKLLLPAVIFIKNSNEHASRPQVSGRSRRLAQPLRTGEADAESTAAAPNTSTGENTDGVRPTP